jgi:integrase/recombinase XerD
MATLVKSTVSARDKAIVMILAKTGVRRGELVRMDVDDVDMERMSIRLKPAAKRSNRRVFFDSETRRVLSDWLRTREAYARTDCPALFITESGGRINRNHVYDIVTKHATRVGLHNP